jgi:hypothetical protein
VDVDVQVHQGRHHAGLVGPYTVRDLIGDVPDEVEADLARYYGPDDQLAQFWRGRLSLRRLRVLVHALPPDSATWTARLGERALWTREVAILADLYDAITALRAEQIAINTENGRPPDLPRYPRPVVETENTQRGEVAAMHNRLRRALNGRAVR